MTFKSRQQRHAIASDFSRLKTPRLSHAVAPPLDKIRSYFGSLRMTMRALTLAATLDSRGSEQLH